MSAPWRSLVEGNENQWLGVWSRSNNRPSSKFVSTWGQCDQIGRIFKSLGSKYSCKSWPNIWQLFRFFWNSFTFAANICWTFVKKLCYFLLQHLVTLPRVYPVLNLIAVKMDKTLNDLPLPPTWIFFIQGYTTGMWLGSWGDPSSSEQSEEMPSSLPPGVSWGWGTRSCWSWSWCDGEW